jgi:ABC-type cobalamin/Fe3+-siderophores transport system ATPase subunit
MLKITNINYTKNNVEILKAIDVVFNEGEITGIIGKSGSGKTSLLETIAGIVNYNEGEILINDILIKSLSKKNRQKYIASLFNDYPYDIIDDTLYNFLLQSRKLYKKIFSPFTDFDAQITEDYIKLFKINDQRDKKVLSLSDGTFKKALLAFQFIKKADVLLLDNPTSNLDMESISLLQKAILKYSIDGDKIIIIASNDLNFLTQTADRILVMEEGRIDAEVNPEKIDAHMINKYFDTEVLLSRNIYNGKPTVHQYLKGIG